MSFDVLMSNTTHAGPTYPSPGEPQSSQERRTLGNMKTFLKEGDQIYLNGANIQVDRKVSIELLNKTKFLLQNHIIKAEEADCPLKQLYFAIQLMIINSVAPDDAKQLYDDAVRAVLETDATPASIQLLRFVQETVRCGREYEALKAIKTAFRQL